MLLVNSEQRLFSSRTRSAHFTDSLSSLNRDAFMKNHDFLSEWNQVPGIIYYPALFLFLFQFYFNNMSWNISLPGSCRTAFLDLAGVLCICGLLCVLIMHDHYVLTFLSIMIICVLYLKYQPWWQDLFGLLLVPVALMIMGMGKKYRTILKCFLLAVVSGYVIALSGQIFGFTRDIITDDSKKIAAVGAGHSLGFYHPNSFAVNALLVCLLVWILWIYRKKALTFLLFWGSAVPIWFITRSRTSILFFVVVPFLTLFTGERRRSSTGPVRKAVGVFLTFLPFIFLAFSIILSLNMEMMYALFNDTPLKNMSTRFVAGGIALETYGVSLLRREIDLSGNITREVCGYTRYLRYIDNGYMNSLIINGALYTAMKLGVLTCVHAKCLKTGNRRLLMLSVVMLLLATMENRGLGFEFNPTYMGLFAALICQNEYYGAAKQPVRTFDLRTI